MADLLTHALVAYSLAVVLSWRYPWIKPYHVTAAMVGATLPDLTRIGLILDPGVIESYGVPFSWTSLHTPVGGMLVVGVLVLLVDCSYRREVFLFLSLGLATHLILDIFLISVTGRTYALFYPISMYRAYAPGFYLSTQVLPAMITGVIASLVTKFGPQEL